MTEVVYRRLFNPNHDKLGRFGTGSVITDPPNPGDSRFGDGDPNGVADSQASYRDGLTAKQKSEVNIYTQDGYADMDAALNGKPIPGNWFLPGHDAEALTMANSLKATVEAAPPLPPSTTLYRRGHLGKDASNAVYTMKQEGVPPQEAGLRYFKSAMPPGTVVDLGHGGFVSSTTSADFASTFGAMQHAPADPVFRIVGAKHGMAVGTLGKISGEHEVIVAPGTRYKVRSIGVHPMRGFVDKTSGGRAPVLVDKIVVTVEEA